jgi:hypothetical protein
VLPTCLRACVKPTIIFWAFHHCVVPRKFARKFSSLCLYQPTALLCDGFSSQHSLSNVLIHARFDNHLLNLPFQNQPFLMRATNNSSVNFGFGRASRLKPRRVAPPSSPRQLWHTVRWTQHRAEETRTTGLPIPCSAIAVTTEWSSAAVDSTGRSNEGKWIALAYDEVGSDKSLFLWTFNCKWQRRRGYS